MKSTSLLLRCTAVVFGVASIASAQTIEPPSVSGRLHLRISDGKGNIKEMDLPEKGPMTMDLTPFKHLMESSAEMEKLAETASQSMDVWAGELTRRLEKLSGGKDAWLGVAVQPVPEAAATQVPALKGAGLVVRDVAPGSPAATAGLVANDILWKLNEQTLFNPEQFQKLVTSLGIGTSVNVVFFRAGVEQKATCTLSAIAHNKVGEVLASALLGAEGAAKVRELVGPGAEMLLSALASNPELLKNLPSVKQVLSVGPDGKLKIADGNAQLMMEQLRHQLAEPSAELPKIIEGVSNSVLENKEAEAMLLRLMEQVNKMEKTNPEVHQQMMEMVQSVIQGMMKHKEAEAMLLRLMEQVNKMEKTNPEVHKQMMEMVQSVIKGMMKK